MGETSIKSFSELKKQGENISDSSRDFIATTKSIYELYDELNAKWTGEKANEYKGKIEKLREPLEIISNVIGTQGEAISEEAQDYERFERS